MLVTFILFLAMFTAVGIASIRSAKGTSDDYLVASRGVHPWAAALSSVATNNSGYMFIGLIGYAYTDGLAAMWLQLGWILGDIVAWAWFHRRLREASGEMDVATLTGLVSRGHRGRVQRTALVVTAAISVIFMITYGAAQLNAGSKALKVMFGWDIDTGAIVGAVIVLAYSFAGGIRASIWTDVAQSIVMILSLGILVVVCLVAVGGFGGLFDALRAADPSLVTIVPEDLKFGFLPWAVGFVFGGLGVIGQPHILVRTMAMRSPEDIPSARRAYFAWYIPFSCFAVLVGLCSRVLLPETASFDAELALPLLSRGLLPDVLVGVILAGLFAATMSTADSLLISASAALTRDLVPRMRRVPKVGTVVATAVALVLALYGPDSVFVLVLIAWSAMATAFGPLLLMRLLRAPVGERLALLMVATGLGTSLVWRFVLGWQGAMYEILPGVAAGLLTWVLARAIGWRDAYGGPGGR